MRLFLSSDIDCLKLFALAFGWPAGCNKVELIYFLEFLSEVARLASVFEVILFDLTSTAQILPPLFR